MPTFVDVALTIRDGWGSLGVLRFHFLPPPPPFPFAISLFIGGVSFFSYLVLDTRGISHC